MNGKRVEKESAKFFFTGTPKNFAELGFIQIFAELAVSSELERLKILLS